MKRLHYLLLALAILGAFYSGYYVGKHAPRVYTVGE